MSRPPILLLHGMFSTPKLLSGWVSLLESAGYRVHAPAYPGHDPVDMAVLSRVTLSDYIAAALAAYDELDEAPIVIGHSIGVWSPSMWRRPVSQERWCCWRRCRPVCCGRSCARCPTCFRSCRSLLRADR